jgi:hypothetical protein
MILLDRQDLSVLEFRVDAATAMATIGSLPRNDLRRHHTAAIRCGASSTTDKKRLVRH